MYEGHPGYTTYCFHMYEGHPGYKTYGFHIYEGTPCIIIQCLINIRDNAGGIQGALAHAGLSTSYALVYSVSLFACLHCANCASSMLQALALFVYQVLQMFRPRGAQIPHLVARIDVL